VEFGLSWRKGRAPVAQLSHPYGSAEKEMETSMYLVSEGERMALYLWELGGLTASKWLAGPTRRTVEEEALSLSAEGEYLAYVVAEERGRPTRKIGREVAKI